MKLLKLTQALALCSSVTFLGAMEQSRSKSPSIQLSQYENNQTDLIENCDSDEEKDLIPTPSYNQTENDAKTQHNLEEYVARIIALEELTQMLTSELLKQPTRPVPDTEIPALRGTITELRNTITEHREEIAQLQEQLKTLLDAHKPVSTDKEKEASAANVQAPTPTQPSRLTRIINFLRAKLSRAPQAT